jgi:hypothetical protein
LAQLVEDPEFVAALNTFQQGTLDARFAALFRKLSLSEGELAAFKRLLVQKEGAEFDVVALGQAISDSPLSAQEMDATVRTIRAGVERDIASTLGSDRYAVYRDYAATLPQRATVAQLEQRLSYTSTPLTPAQSDAMVQILASNTSATEPVLVTPTAMIGEGEAADTVPFLRRTLMAAVVTDAAVANAQGVLSPEQIAALTQIQQEQLAALRANELIRAASPDLPPPADWSLLLQ